MYVKFLFLFLHVQSIKVLNCCI